MIIDERLLTINSMSRPGLKLDSVKNIVIHNVNNSGSSAIANRNYYENLKYQDRVSVSVHYIIGLNGEIIKIIPEDEISYHSGNKEFNRTSIGVENTYFDAYGKFTDSTYNSLVELLVYLIKKYNLNPLTDIVRHYDVTAKNCPKYYVSYPLEFEKLKSDVSNQLVK